MSTHFSQNPLSRRNPPPFSPFIKGAGLPARLGSARARPGPRISLRIFPEFFFWKILSRPGSIFEKFYPRGQKNPQKVISQRGEWPWAPSPHLREFTAREWGIRKRALLRILCEACPSTEVTNRGLTFQSWKIKTRL